MDVRKITELDLAESVKDAAHLLITQPEYNESAAADVESIRRVSMALFLSRVSTVLGLTLNFKGDRDAGSWLSMPSSPDVVGDVYYVPQTDQYYYLKTIGLNGWQVLPYSSIIRDVAAEITETSVKPATSAAVYAFVTSKCSAVFRYRGSVTSISKLYMIDAPEIGDVFNICGPEYDGDGMNYAWNGESWDALGSLVPIAHILSPESSDVPTSAAVAGYVDEAIKQISGGVVVDNTVTETGEYAVTGAAVHAYVNEKVSAIYRYKGTVATLDELTETITNPEIGDVYNVEKVSYVADDNMAVYEANGMNYAWNGESWDALGASTKIRNTVDANSSALVTSQAIYDFVHNTIAATMEEYDAQMMALLGGDEE